MASKDDYIPLKQSDKDDSLRFEISGQKETDFTTEDKIETPIIFSKSETNLIEAARYGDLKTMHNIMSSTDIAPDAILMEAVKGGHLKLVKYIASSQTGNLKEVFDDGNTLVHYAAQSGSIEVLDFLINELNLDEEQKNSFNQTPLMIATIHNHVNSVKYLLNKISNDVEIDTEGMTSLAYACETGNEIICRLFLEAGSNLTNRYPMQKYNKIVLEFTNQYSKVESNEESKMESKTAGFSVLFPAAWNDNGEVVKMLLNKMDTPTIISHLRDKHANNLTLFEILTLAKKDEMLAIIVEHLPLEEIETVLDTCSVGNITAAHHLLNSSCHKTLKIIFDKCIDANLSKCHAVMSPSILEIQRSFGKKSTIISPSLINELSREDANSCLTAHPLVKLYTDYKFSKYAWYAWIHLDYYLLFLFLLSVSVFQYAYFAGRGPNDYAEKTNIFRLFCQIITVILTIGYLFVWIFDYIISVYSLFTDMQNGIISSNCCFLCLKIWSKPNTKLLAVGRSIYYMFYACVSSLNDTGIILGLLGNISIFILLAFWATSSPTVNLISSIVLLINYLRFFTSLRYFSCMGGYTNGILKLFTHEYLRLMITFIIVLVGIYLSVLPAIKYQNSNQTFYDFFEADSNNGFYSILDQLVFGEAIILSTFAKFIIFIIAVILVLLVCLLMGASLIAKFVHYHDKAFYESHIYKLEVINEIERKTFIGLLSLMPILKYFRSKFINISHKQWNNYCKNNNNNISSCACEFSRINKGQLSNQLEDAYSAEQFEVNSRINSLKSMLEIITKQQTSLHQQIKEVCEGLNESNALIRQVGGADLKDEMNDLSIQVTNITGSNDKMSNIVSQLAIKLEATDGKLTNKIDTANNSNLIEFQQLDSKLGAIITNIEASDHGKDFNEKLAKLSSEGVANQKNNEKNLKAVTEKMDQLYSIFTGHKSEQDKRLTAIENNLNGKMSKIEKALNLVLDKLTNK